MTCIGAPQSCAAATVPWSVPNPSRKASLPNRSRHSWPTLNSPRVLISVAAALPTWELCAHTTALASGP